jgi:hypothetical protein
MKKTSDTPKQSETEDNEVHNEDTFQASRESGSEHESSVKDEETSDTCKQSENKENEARDEDTFRASGESRIEQESSVKEPSDNRKQPEKIMKSMMKILTILIITWTGIPLKRNSNLETSLKLNILNFIWELKKANSFRIMLHNDEWKKIKPNHENPKKSQKGFTDMFANKSNLIPPSCALSFKII